MADRPSFAAEHQRLIDEIAAHPRAELIEDLADVMHDIEDDDGNGRHPYYYRSLAYATVEMLPALQLGVPAGTRGGVMRRYDPTKVTCAKCGHAGVDHSANECWHGTPDDSCGTGEPVRLPGGVDSGQCGCCWFSLAWKDPT
jgi:hypothetical protein